MPRIPTRTPDANKAHDSASPETNRSTDGVNDPLLGRFLHARSENERQQEMAELLAEHAHARVSRILAGRFRQSSLPFDQMDDVRGDIVLRLVKRLRRLADDPAEQAISSFRDYVAMVAFNTFDEFVRRAWPLRTKLRNRIRYVATHDARFTTWETANVLVCGLAEWHGRAPSAPPAASIELPLKPSDLRAALLRLFTAIQSPLAFEDVVSILAHTWGYPAQETPRPLDPLYDIPSAQPDRGIESVQYLRNLWNEIRALPLHQRFALLLHARAADGEPVVRLLPLARVATIAAIAAALEIPPEELAALWRELPLDDLSIAARLGLTRPQVISLRRSARERLMRRMRGREEGRKRR